MTKRVIDSESAMELSSITCLSVIPVSWMAAQSPERLRFVSGAYKLMSLVTIAYWAVVFSTTLPTVRVYLSLCLLS